MKNTELNRLYVGENVNYSMDCYETKRNNNVLVLGSSGAGKTRNYFVPNLLSGIGSYIVSDPKGSLYKKYGEFMRKNGYTTRVIDFVDFEQGEGYNIFSDLKTEEDYIRVANLLSSSYSTESSRMDPFWDTTEKMTLSGIMSCLNEAKSLIESTPNRVSQLLMEERIAVPSAVPHRDVLVKQLLLNSDGYNRRNFRAMNNLLDDLLVEYDGDRENKMGCTNHYLEKCIREVKECSRDWLLDRSMTGNDYSAFRYLRENVNTLLQNYSELPGNAEVFLRLFDELVERTLEAGNSFESPAVKNGCNGFLLTITDIFLDNLKKMCSYGYHGHFTFLKAARPNCFGVKQLSRVLSLNAEKTTGCIIMSAHATLSAAYDIDKLNDMMDRAENHPFDFKGIAKDKTVVFVCVSDNDRKLDGLANAFYTSALQKLIEFADKECSNQSLPIHTRLMFDDFSTNAVIKNFPRMINSFRSRNISATLALQSLAQLRQSYGYDAESIISSCDTIVYFGNNSLSDAQDISERTNRPLEDILYLPVGECIIFRRGERPRFDRQIDHDRFLQWVGFEKNPAENRKKDKTRLMQIS